MLLPSQSEAFCPCNMHNALNSSKYVLVVANLHGSLIHDRQKLKLPRCPTKGNSKETGTFTRQNKPTDGRLILSAISHTTLSRRFTQKICTAGDFIKINSSVKI